MIFLFLFFSYAEKHSRLNAAIEKRRYDVCILQEKQLLLDVTKKKLLNRDAKVRGITIPYRIKIRRNFWRAQGHDFERRARATQKEGWGRGEGGGPGWGGTGFAGRTNATGALRFPSSAPSSSTSVLGRVRAHPRLVELCRISRTSIILCPLGRFILTDLRRALSWVSIPLPKPFIERLRVHARARAPASVQL